MTPAEKFIKAAGSVPKAAKLLGINRVWVWRWTQPKDKGGTDGRIPQEHHAEVMRLSRKHKWNIGAADIIGV